VAAIGGGKAGPGVTLARLQLGEELELVARQRGDEADDAGDGAEQLRRDRRRLRVRQLHDQAARAEAVDKVADVVGAHLLRAADCTRGLR